MLRRLTAGDGGAAYRAARHRTGTVAGARHAAPALRMQQLRRCPHGGAPAPERPIDGGMATEALIVHVVVSKFCDGLPLYRQSQMLARQGVTLDRSMLSNWVGRACWWLTPLYELIVGTVLAATKL